MKEGRQYFDFASGSSHADKLNFFVVDQDAENFMASEDKFDQACTLARLLPWVDICSDTLGTNSLCPYYLSAEDDCTAVDLSGWTAWSNPPFKYFDRIVRSLEEQAAGAVLLLPVFSSDKEKAMDALVARNRWSLLTVWSLSAEKVFSGPSSRHPLHPVRRTYA